MSLKQNVKTQLFRMFILLCLMIVSLHFSRSAHAENAAYFHQFDYTVEKDDDGDGTITYQWRVLMTPMNDIQVTPTKMISVDAMLYLTPGNQYLLRYKEMTKIRANENSPWEYQPSGPDEFCPVYQKGTWSAPDLNFVTTSGFFGEAATADGLPGVKITFPKKLRSPEIAGKAFVFAYGYSNVSMEDMVGTYPFCPAP